MLKKSFVFIGIASAVAFAGAAQAATPTVLTPITTVSGNTDWQNIGEVSYTFADNNNDSVLDVGDTVTFSLAMHKKYWGTHRFDAMRVWLDGPGTQLTENFKWTYDPSLKNMDDFGKGPNDHYSNKLWTDGDKIFSFSHTFATAGTYDLLASVMCSRDLSTSVLKNRLYDDPGDDWSDWTRNIHSTKYLQGEDKNYRLTIAAVPEPETYAMILAGLTMLGAIARRKKQG